MCQLNHINTSKDVEAFSIEEWGFFLPGYNLTHEDELAFLH